MSSIPIAHNIKIFTYEDIVQLKPQMIETGKKYISLVRNSNRKSYKPEFDNIFISEGVEVNDGLSKYQKLFNLGKRIAIVNVSIIETILKPMTFILSYYVFESGLVFPTYSNVNMGMANCYKPIVEDVVDKAKD
jgi:hypothetical protein